jgi:hypothetical protein
LLSLQADSSVDPARATISFARCYGKVDILAKQTARATGITAAGDDDGNFVCKRSIMISRRDAPELCQCNPPKK